MNTKKTSRIFVASQFVLASIVILSSIIENSLTQRPVINALNIGSIIFMILGLAIVVTALAAFRQKITPNPIPLDTAKLRTEGIYGIIRHPMYCSVVFFITGFSLYERAYYSFLLNVVVVIFLCAKMRFEEKQLVEKFPEYKEYQTRTKKLIPFVY